ncbi:MAG: hypothetical protein J7K83_03195 [Candidatus Aenigmarchaeota archaeon]|nr:hypothetical protein [Candidatus Aenigmarchaeota archaeon]
MRCARCGSPRVVKFIDAFGNHRVFCRDCGMNISFDVFKKITAQKSLLEFDPNKYMNHWMIPWKK